MAIQTSNRLTDLAESIRAATTKAKTASVESAEQYLVAGHLLIAAKAEVAHGHWLPFLEMAGVSKRQAQRLMQLANSGLKSDTVALLGVKAALESLARMKPEAEGVMKEMRHRGIVVLPVHDSFLAPASKATELEAVMVDEAAKFGASVFCSRSSIVPMG